MRKLAVAGISVAAVTTGSLAVAAVVPVGTALAQDTGPTTTTPPASGPTGRAPGAGPLGKVLQGLVTDGAITQAQADAITAKLGEAVKDAKGRIGKGALGRLGATVQEIATYLGTDPATLREQLKTTSLGQLAGDKKAGLVQLLTDKANARIDDLVAKGRLDATKAANLKTEAASRIAALVDQVGGPKGPLGGLGGRPRGGR